MRLRMFNPIPQPDGNEAVDLIAREDIDVCQPIRSGGRQRSRPPRTPATRR
jgi:hypothetical protein